jgi:DNA (cytosine-5)-methyltransferase 1
VTLAVDLYCPACGAGWKYTFGMELLCPGCGVEVLLGGDLFCGAGGSTKGALAAIRELRRPVLFTCVNHWQRAIETHSRNHPYARHFVQDISLAEPEQLVPEGWLDFLWASPECRYHSQARGGRPINDQQRMDPWSVIRWLTSLDVRLLLIENVPEFVGWGPLMRDGMKDKTKRGLYFEEWVRVLQGLGYEVQWRMLNAADFGDATTRVRFFLQARKDGLPIRWPEPSHAQKPDPMFANRKRWRGAREIIDWSNAGRSLLDDPRYRDKPLSEKTRRRIARGLERFGGVLAPLYINLLGLETDATPSGAPHAFVMGKQSSPAYRDVGTPLLTLTTKAAPALVEPCVEPLVGANRNHNVPRPAGEPIPPATTAPGGGLFILEPTAKPFVIGQHGGATPREASEPLPTITTDGAISLIEPLIIPYYRTGVAHPSDEPLDTVTTKGRFGLVAGLVIPYGPAAEARGAEEPLGLASFILSRHSNDLLRPVEEPVPTATGRGAGYLVEPFIVPQFSERDGQAPRVHSVDAPLPATTSHGAGRLVEPCLVQVNDSSKAPHGRVRSCSDPLWTVTTHRNVGLVEAIAEKVEAGELDPRRLVVIDDVLYQLDLRFRMLNNRELARAMSFDDGETQYEFVGNVGEVTKQIGNAVPVRTATALVRTILEDSLP